MEAGHYGVLSDALKFGRLCCGNARRPGGIFALLSGRVRSSAVPLVAIASLTLALRFVEASWLALPEAEASGLVLLLAIPAAVLASGGAWMLALRFALHHVARTPVPRLRAAEA